MYTGRALKSNIEWLIIRIRTARNRSRLGKSSIIFKSICWSSSALLSNGIKFVHFLQTNGTNNEGYDNNCKLDNNNVDDKNDNIDKNNDDIDNITDGDHHNNDDNNVVVVVAAAANNDMNINVNITSTDEEHQSETIDDILRKSDQLFDRNRLMDAKLILDQINTVSYCQIIASTMKRINLPKINFKLKSDHNNANNINNDNELQDNRVPEIEWRKARLLYSLSKLSKDRKEQKSLIDKAYELIKSALKNYHEHFAIHKWMAIILDAKVEFDDINTRIIEINNIRKHMEYAVKLNPNDPISWYFLGEYEFGLADLSWLHKKLLKFLTNLQIPNGSYEKAFKHFQHAENLSPEFYSKNLLMLGKCSIALQKLNDAKKFLRKVTNFHVINREDQNCQKEAVELLRRIGTVKCK